MHGTAWRFIVHENDGQKKRAKRGKRQAKTKRKIIEFQFVDAKTTQTNQKETVCQKKPLPKPTPPGCTCFMYLF